MIPTVSLIGRTGVGKSTLFNRLTCTRDALVCSDPLGLTRDRKYGLFKWKQYQSTIVDTAGIEVIDDRIGGVIFNQSKCAILESDLILFVVDGKKGLIPLDHEIIRYLYKFKKSIFVVVNKIDHIVSEYKKIDFYSLGIRKVIPISASHGFGVDVLLKDIFLKLKCKIFLSDNKIFNKNEELKFFFKNPSFFLKDNRSDIIVVAVIGPPNSGKSTFINRVLGENRMIVCPLPGTTRDSVCVSTIYDDSKFVLFDTAGICKKNSITSNAEELSISRTLKIIECVTVVLLLVNADRGIFNYELSLLNIVIRSGKFVVIGVNKWDCLSYDLQKKFKKICSMRMNFVRCINIHFISALYGDGVHDVLKSIVRAHSSSLKSVNTSFLTRIMHIAIDKYKPPRVHGKQVKLKYAHIGGHVPLIIVIHGSYVTGLPGAYKRYLINYFSSVLCMSGSSIFIRFKENK